jgi:hypothetical protein
MRRTELPTGDPEDEVRRGVGGWQEGRLLQEEARLLGVCERTFRRQIDRYEQDGLEGTSAPQCPLPGIGPPTPFILNEPSRTPP